MKPACFHASSASLDEHQAVGPGRCEMVGERHVALHQSLDRLHDLLVGKAANLGNLAREDTEIQGESFGVCSKITAPRRLRLDPRALEAATNQGPTLHKPDARPEHRGSGASRQGGLLPFGLRDAL